MLLCCLKRQIKVTSPCKKQNDDILKQKIMTIKVVRKDSRNKGKYRIVKLDLHKNGRLKRASTIYRNLSLKEANRLKQL